MMPVEEARENLAWALHHEDVNFEGEIGDGFCGSTAWPAQFTRGDRVCTVAIPVEWLDDCSPSTDYLPPPLRSLLRFAVPDYLNEAL